MQRFDLQVLPASGPIKPYQVYQLPELNAVMAFGPLDRNFMVGKITFILERDTPIKDAKKIWTCHVAWHDSRWGSELDLRIGDVTHRHAGYEETLALVQAQAEKDSEEKNGDIEEENAMDAYLEKVHGQLMVPALLPSEPPIWMIRTAIHGGQNGNLTGTISVTHGNQVYPGWFEEQDEPYDSTTYGVGQNAAAQLPAGTVFDQNGRWEHVNAEYAYLFE